MGLLRRNRRPPNPPPGDWMDALQAAMWVDPSLRPKRDRQASDEMPTWSDDHDDVATEAPPRPSRPAEVPRRFRTPVPAADDVAPPAGVADPPSTRAALPRSARAWLTPIPSPADTDASPVLTAATPPIAVEELFQWVCRLSRQRRAGGTTDAFAADALRAAAEQRLSAVAAVGSVGQRLQDPLASFLDVVMLRGGLPLTGVWRPLGPVPPERAYGRAAAESAADPTGLHDGTWAAHHAALSLVADLLPPAGDFPGGSAVLEVLDAKLHGMTPPDDRICPGAYEGVFDHAIVRPVGRPIRAVAAAAVGVLLLAVAAAVLLNLRYVAQLRGSIGAVDRTLHEEPQKAVQPQMGHR